MGTNTYSSALLVGEKGADLICQDLGTYLNLHSQTPAKLIVLAIHRSQGQDAPCSCPPRPRPARQARYSAGAVNTSLNFGLLSWLGIFVTSRSVTLSSRHWKTGRSLFVVGVCSKSNILCMYSLSVRCKMQLPCCTITFADA